MITAIRFNRYEFSEKELKKLGDLNASEEICIRFNMPNPLLPVNFQGKNTLIPWAPCSKLEEIHQGKFANLRPKKATVLITAVSIKGVWTNVREGLECMIIQNKKGERTASILTKSSSHYFKIMTGDLRMPIFINQNV